MLKSKKIIDSMCVYQRNLEREGTAYEAEFYIDINIISNNLNQISI